jgi:hypothetical protein
MKIGTIKRLFLWLPRRSGKRIFMFLLGEGFRRQIKLLMLSKMAELNR